MAGYSINKIPEQHRIFVPSISNLWASSAPVGAPLVPSSTEKYPGEGSIQVSMIPEGSVSFNLGLNESVGLSSTPRVTSSDIGDSVSVFVWVKTNRPVILDLKVYLLYPPSIVATTPFDMRSGSISVSSGEWTLLRLYDLPVMSNDVYEYPIGFKISLVSIEGGPTPTVTMNISHPVIYSTLDFINNPAILEIMSRFPEFIRDEDANAEPLPYQFIRFMEAATIHTDEIYDLLNRFIYEDISEGKDITNPQTLSILVDPSVALRKYLPWLAQFSGTSIINPTTGFTPWENIPNTWQQIDLIDGEAAVPPADPNSADAVEWSALQDYDTEPEGLEEFLRWQATNGYYGIRAGTREAIIASVERVLTGTKTVTYQVIEPFNWTIKISTLKTETPDSGLLEVGDSVAEIVDLLEPTRPLGYTIIHELV
jgi:hypothetical protein